MLHGYLLEFLKVLQLDADRIFAEKISTLAVALCTVEVSLSIYYLRLSLNLGQGNLSHDGLDFFWQIQRLSVD